MSLENLFSPKGDTIDIVGIESLSKLCKYNPVKKDKFFDGLELAEDLKGAKDVTLYTSGTQITPDRVQRLINLSDASRELVMKFKIKRSAKLILNFKQDIQSKLTKLVEHRKNFKVYSNLLGSINDEVEAFVDEILTNEDIILTIYKMKFAADSSSSKNSKLYFFHTISVAIFSFAIAKSKVIAEKMPLTHEDFADLMKAAFFHNIGSMCRIDEFINKEEADRKKLYIDFNRSSSNMLNDVQLNFDIIDTVRFVNEYYFDRLDFVGSIDRKPALYANLIVIADLYLQEESGIFGKKNKPKHIVDQLNMQAMSGKLNKDVVQALTLGLNLEDIFDFYQEIESLKGMCDFDSGGHAAPYPLTGFKSPTIFICKSNKEKCEYCEKSLKAVTLVKAVGDLPEGKYSRCMLTTPKLLEFYSDHYEEIKKDE